VDVRLSAWYGEAGLRFIASPHSAVRPYFEGTAGIARLRPSVLDAGSVGAIANAALVFLDRTEPMFGAGAGVMLVGGPMLIDIGYRYNRISVGNSIASALTLGRSSIDVNQVRVGVGFRF
jgi:opacity protein-like surface antigen